MKISIKDLKKMIVEAATETTAAKTKTIMGRVFNFDGWATGGLRLYVKNR